MGIHIKKKPPNGGFFSLLHNTYSDLFGCVAGKFTLIVA